MNQIPAKCILIIISLLLICESLNTTRNSTNQPSYFHAHHYKFSYNDIIHYHNTQPLINDSNVLISIINASSLSFLINDKIILNNTNFNSISYKYAYKHKQHRRRILDDPKEMTIPAEASGKQIQINCDSPISIKSARYGPNCAGGGSDQTQNLQQACDNKQSCSYTIDHNKIGDPAHGCPKTFQYSYACKPKEQHQQQPHPKGTFSDCRRHTYTSQSIQSLPV